ncbi:MAG: aminotransferase class V-fold PLP-dependent enzyme [bacterium]
MGSPAIRNLFPALQKKPAPILLNNGATTPPMRPAIEAAKAALQRLTDLSAKPKELGKFVAAEMAACRQFFLEFVSSQPDHLEVNFFYNTTYALNEALHQVELNDGDVIIETIYSHNSAHNPVHNRVEAERAKGKYIKLITIRLEDNDFGTRLDQAALKQAIADAGPALKLVVLTHASNLTGHITSIHEAARAAHTANPDALVLVDAAQTFARLPIDMKGPDDLERIDILVAPSHKSYAISGSAVLISPVGFTSQAEPLLIGEDAQSLVSAASFQAAMTELQTLGLQREEIWQHELALKRHFYELTGQTGLSSSAGLFEQNKDFRFTDTLGTILLVETERISAKRSPIMAMERTLLQQGIECRVGASCADELALALANIREEKSIRTALIDIRDRGRSFCYPGFSLLRLSPGIFTTPEEIEQTQTIVRSVKYYYTNNTPPSILPVSPQGPMLSVLGFETNSKREIVAALAKETEELQIKNLEPGEQGEKSDIGNWLRTLCQRHGISLTVQDITNFMAAAEKSSGLEWRWGNKLHKNTLASIYLFSRLIDEQCIKLKPNAQLVDIQQQLLSLLSSCLHNSELYFSNLDFAHFANEVGLVDPIYDKETANTPTAVLEVMAEHYGSLGRGGGPQQQNAALLMDRSRQAVINAVSSGQGRELFADFTAHLPAAIRLLTNSVGLFQGDTVISFGFPYPVVCKSEASEISLPLPADPGQVRTSHLLAEAGNIYSLLKAVAVNLPPDCPEPNEYLQALAGAIHGPANFIKLIVAINNMSAQQVRMGFLDRLNRIDMLAFDGPSIGLPIGIAAYVADYSVLSGAAQLVSGGGTIDLVSCQLTPEINLSHNPGRLRAGTPDLMGAVMLANALQRARQT